MMPAMTPVREMSSAGSYQFTAVAAFIGLAQKQRLHDVRAHRSRDPGASISRNRL
jgi:hypothetical protein